MKRIIQYLKVLFIGVYMGCSGDGEIGNIEPLTPDYELPQGKSSADNRIVEIYDQYRSYILYEYADKDVYYDDGIDETRIAYQLPDPKYVEGMMDLLDKIWFNIYSEKFHRQTLPYQIFLAKEIHKLSDGEVVSEEFVYSGANSFIIGKCNENLNEITEEEIREYKNTLQVKLWAYLKQYAYIDFPEEFFEVSDYSKVAIIEDKTSPDYARARGFVEGYQRTRNWYTQLLYPANAIDKDIDVITFIECMVTRSAEEWKDDLTWPLVKEKYDILRNWMQKHYSFDIQYVGDLFCE